MDNAGNLWTLSSGMVLENGAAAGFSANVILVLYYNGNIYQENSALGWWEWNSASNPPWVEVSGDPREEGTPTPTPTATAQATASPTVPTREPLGINLSSPAYYTTNLPFLNLMKSGGTSSNMNSVNGWYTQKSSAWDTGEEAYLSLDSDGYPTSLTASPTPAGGQQFTYVTTLLNYNMGSVAPGATTVYPPGSYRLKFEGQGTIVIGGDASLTLSNNSPNTYVSGTFTVANPNYGLTLQIQAINSSTDYPRDISVVQSTYASAYDNGQVFNPSFISMLSIFSSLRFMDWSSTNAEFTPFTFSGTLAAGATSGTLSSAWIYPSGTYSIVFLDGETRSASFTLNSTTFQWTTPLANSLSGTTWQGNNQYAGFWVDSHLWAQRPLPSNAFWNLKGVPLEIEVALANQINANAHFNVPLLYSDNDIKSMGQLIMSGTGMQNGYAALNQSLDASFELSNEVWNFVFPQAPVAVSLGANMWPTRPSNNAFEWNRSYFGMRTAQMAADLESGVGSGLFTRVIPVLGAQVASTWTATDSLASTYWSSGPASNYPIKAIAVAPYWGGNPSASDCTQMTSQPDGGIADFFATLHSQTGASGLSYSSVPAGGWLTQAENWITSYAAIMPSYPQMKLIAYEGGQNFYATTSGTCANWPNLVTTAERSALMGTAYTGYLNFWKTTVGGTASNINNIFSDVGAISKYGAWGIMESLMQAITPLSSAPAKYGAAANYVQGN